jgi:protein-S-isoprenylcysteine O-methyltransferase Ste14
MAIFWLIVSILLWGLIHSLLASRQAKAVIRRFFGPAVDRFYRLFYNLFAGFSFLPSLALAALAPDRTLYLVQWPWSFLMVSGMLLAVIALVVGFLKTDAWEFLGLRQAAGMVEKKDGKLVTSGLYHYVRHPLYTAGLVFIWLMPLMTVNVLAINAALTLYVVIGAYFEERKLHREFGQAYADYVATTPMFLPFLKGNKVRNKTSV